MNKLLVLFLLMCFSEGINAQQRLWCETTSRYDSIGGNSFIRITFISNIKSVMGNLSQQYLTSPKEADMISFDTLFLFGRFIVNDILSVLENLKDSVINDSDLNYWSTISVNIDNSIYDFYMDESCRFLRYKDKTYFDVSQSLHNYFFEILSHKLISSDKRKLFIDFKKKYR